LGGAFRSSQPIEITSNPLSLTEAIGRAGVNTSEADLSGLILKRDGISYPINMEALGLESSSAGRIFLKNNDELYIPYNDRRKVFLMGELQQQRALPFKTTGISLIDAITTAGGLRQETSKSEAVYVIRDTSPVGRPGAVTTIFTLDTDSPTALALSSSFQLSPSDVVYVGTAQISRWNRFLSQLFPSASLVNQAQNIRNDN
jgi:polysaccharide export outer membrane protein